MFGRRGFNRRQAKNQRGIWFVAPPASTGISPPANQFAAIKCYQMREIRLRGFQKRTHPQPAKAGFACLAGAVFNRRQAKNQRGRGIVASSSTGISPGESIRGYEKRETREGGFCMFGRRGFNRRRAKNQ